MQKALSSPVAHTHSCGLGLTLVFMLTVVAPSVEGMLFSSTPVLGTCASAVGSWLMQASGVVCVLAGLYLMWSRMVSTPFNAALTTSRGVTGSSRHPRYANVWTKERPFSHYYVADSQPSVHIVPGCRRSAMGDGILRLCGLKNPWSKLSPNYVVDDRFYPDQTNFIIANSRPGDGSTPEHRTPSCIHLPTATFYVCAECDMRFNQFWDWARICPNCNRSTKWVAPASTLSFRTKR